MFLGILNFEPNLPFWKAFSLCIVANFGHFPKLVISPILGVFLTNIRRFFFMATKSGRSCLTILF